MALNATSWYQIPHYGTKCKIMVPNASLFFVSMVLLRIPTAAQPMTGIEGSLFDPLFEVTGRKKLDRPMRT